MLVAVCCKFISCEVIDIDVLILTVSGLTSYSKNCRTQTDDQAAATAITSDLLIGSSLIKISTHLMIISPNTPVVDHRQRGNQPNKSGQRR